MPKERRHIGSFPAVSQSGDVRTIHVYQEFIISKSLNAPPEETPSWREFITEDGKRVNYLEKGKYQLVATREILTSTDPNAF
jgi:hypothetical protein